jgi:hypothetical protein
MKDQDYTTTFSVDEAPKVVFDAVSNVRGWWSEEIDGTTDKMSSRTTTRTCTAARCG